MMDAEFIGIDIEHDTGWVSVSTKPPNWRGPTKHTVKIRVQNWEAVEVNMTVAETDKVIAALQKYRDEVAALNGEVR